MRTGSLRLLFRIDNNEVSSGGVFVEFCFGGRGVVYLPSLFAVASHRRDLAAARQQRPKRGVFL